MFELRAFENRNSIEYLAVELELTNSTLPIAARKTARLSIVQTQALCQLFVKSVRGDATDWS